MAVSRKELANAIRFLSIDAVQNANSGHPGMPLGMADIAEVLWNSHLQHNPANPNFPNRDRFVLSNGHGCMLLYSALHLSGYKVSIEDIKNFRKINSHTAGHPEAGELPGVETTTGPLGQGIANAVGMAIAEAILAKTFNKPEFELINNHTYCFVGDGCLMEGISHEAASLAGTLGLGKLIVIWDDNNISIDGKVDDWFNENTAARFSAYNWQVIENVDGHDSNQIDAAINSAKADQTKPTLICCKTTIGYGSPNFAGSAKTHGAPLGEEEVALVRKNLSWAYKEFEVPAEIYNAWNAISKGNELETKWQQQFSEYTKHYPKEAAEFSRRINRELPENWLNSFNLAINNINEINLSNDKKDIATRKASQNALNTLASIFPELIGGSADLSCSNLTNHKLSKAITSKDFSGNYINYGVREFGMAAIMNGISLYGGFIPYAGTFLVFADYAKNAMRLSCISKQQVIYVLTHDSIGLGEDGPTHQPIEHLAMLRYMPGMSVWRPADEVETFVAYREALLYKSGPTSLALSRQSLPALNRTQKQLEDIANGAYIIQSADGSKSLDLNIIATGSELHLALNAAAKIMQDSPGINLQVVSMPNNFAFDRQDAEYQQKVIPDNVPTVAIEASYKDYWYKYTGKNGLIIGMDSFGKSGDAKDVFKEFGFSVDAVVEQINSWLNRG